MRRMAGILVSDLLSSNSKIFGQKVNQPSFNVPFFLGELLTNAVAGVTLLGRAAAGACEDFFAKRQVVVAPHICQRASLVKDHAGRAELIRDQPIDLGCSCTAARCYR